MKYDRFVRVYDSTAASIIFLSKAVIDDLTRPLLKCIRIEESEKGEGKLLGVATDGRCMHIVDDIDKNVIETYELTTGNWEVVRRRKISGVWLARISDRDVEKLYKFDWKKVIPQGNATFKTIFEKFNIKGGNYEIQKLIRSFPEFTAFNIKYLQQLSNGQDWDVEWYGPNKSVKFTSDNMTAVIMPMRT